MAIVGTLVVESLALRIDVALRLRRIHRIPASHAPRRATRDQSAQWTLIDLTCLDDSGDEVARQLAAALTPDAGNADYATTTTIWGSSPAGVGISAAQLDWPDNPLIFQPQPLRRQRLEPADTLPIGTMEGSRCNGRPVLYVSVAAAAPCHRRQQRPVAARCGSFERASGHPRGVVGGLPGTPTNL